MMTLEKRHICLKHVRVCSYLLSELMRPIWDFNGELHCKVDRVFGAGTADARAWRGFWI